MYIDFSNLEKHIVPHFYNLLGNQDRYLLLMGGAGSGKSHFAAQKLLLRILLSFVRETKEKFLIVRKTKPEVRKSCFELFKHYIFKWNLDKLCRIRESNPDILFINGSKLEFAGVDDSEKLKSIEGVTSIWIEEATGILESDFEELDRRLRGKFKKSYKQIIFTFNPISQLHWIKRKFYDTLNDNALLNHSTYKDNPFLDEFYYEVLESKLSSNKKIYDVYTLGLWGSLDEVIYSNWKVQEISKLSYTEIERVFGVDFGFNNANVILKVGFRDNDILIFDEIYVVRKNNKEFKSLINDFMTDFEKRRYELKCDSSRPEFIKEFSDAGFWATGGSKSVLDGIDWIQRKNIIVDPKCKHTINELQTYRFKKLKSGIVTDEPVKINDHCMDALRYACSDRIESFSSEYLKYKTIVPSNLKELHEI